MSPSQTELRALALGEDTSAYNAASARSVPIHIVVDLDRTLVATDTLQEQVAVGFFSNPLLLIRCLLQLLRGRAAFKAALAKEFAVRAENLPVRVELLDWLRLEMEGGRQIHLCSAADQAVVNAVAAHFGIFTTATGSNTLNLKGRAKAEHLTRAFPEGFSYAGDSRADLAVWREAKRVILAGASPAVAKAAHDLGKPIEAEFAGPRLTARECFKALRVHHWSKNALIFVPLILAHAWNDLSAVTDTFLGLVCLLLATSATYILNDIADLDADRRHWSKRDRALASGRLPILVGFLFSGLALSASLVGGFLLSLQFALALSAYVALTLGYSFGLKRVPLLDTLIIGILFTTRLVMGIALGGHVYSEWLLTFSVFFFFSLAIAKRHTEIIRAAESAAHSLGSRGYQTEDAPLTLIFGVSSSIASLLVMALFIVEQVRQRDLYGHPAVLWGIPIMLSIWVGRVWLLAHRGQMTDDPVSFALRDRASQFVACCVAVIFLTAL